jgi:hypothetical protein
MTLCFNSSYKENKNKQIPKTSRGEIIKIRAENNAIDTKYSYKELMKKKV